MKFAALVCMKGFFALMFSTSVMAQVGIASNTLDSVFDIAPSNSSAPAITDGISVTTNDMLASANFKSAKDNIGIQTTTELSETIGIGNEDPSASLYIKGDGSIAGSAPVKLNAVGILSSPGENSLINDGVYRRYPPRNEQTVLSDLPIKTGSANFSKIGPQTSGEKTITVTNASVNSSCKCNPVGPVSADLKWTCYVNEENIVTIRVTNLSNDQISGFTMNYKATVIE